MKEKIGILLASILVVVLINGWRGFNIGVSSKSTIDPKDVIPQIMNYKMPNVVNRCQTEFGYTAEDMHILEKELKRFLILCVIIEGGVGMYSKDVDNLWHSFILFTKEYADFCQQYNRKFIHHAPELEKPKTEVEFAKARDKFRKFIINYEHIFKEPVHDIWLLDMCEKNMA